MRRLLTAAPLSLALLLIAAPGAVAEPKQETSQGTSVVLDVDRADLVLGERLELRVIVTGPHDELQPPETPGFTLIQQELETRWTQSGALTRETKVIRYLLQPVALGTHTFGPLEVYHEGELAGRSGTVSVEVREDADAPALTPAAARNRVIVPGAPAVVQVDVSRDSVYVGEPFVVTWRLYWPAGPALHSATVVKAPRYDAQASGLTHEGLASSSAALVTHPFAVGDEQWLYADRAQQLLIPSKPGKVRIDPLTIAAELGGRRYVVQSPPVELEVRPVPASEARPVHYRDGNVGRWSLSSKLTLEASGGVPQRPKVGEPLILDVEATGRGNFDALQPPVVISGDAFTVTAIDPVRPGIVTHDATGVHGTRRWRYRVVPEKPGTHPTPVAHLAYFDPHTETYRARDVGGGSLRLAPDMVSLTGSTTLGSDGLYAARAEVGWPDTRLTYVLPFTEDLDISPQLRFRYGHNLETGLVGFEPGAELRWTFWRGGRLSAALLSEPALLLWIPTDGREGALGMRVGIPGVVLGVRVSNRVNLSFGLRTPLSVLFTEARPTVLLPVLGDIGLEVMAMSTRDLSWSFTAKASIGPEVCLSKCGADKAPLAVDLLLGSTFVW